MRAKMAAAVAFLTITLLVLTTFAVAYSGMDEEFRYGMMENGHHRDGRIHDMTGEEHGQCEAIHEEHHNTTATIQRKNQRRACH